MFSQVFWRGGSGAEILCLSGAERGHFGGNVCQGRKAAGEVRKDALVRVRGCGGGGITLAQMAQEFLDEEVAVTELSLQALYAGVEARA